MFRIGNPGKGGYSHNIYFSTLTVGRDRRDTRNRTNSLLNVFLFKSYICALHTSKIMGSIRFGLSPIRVMASIDDVSKVSSTDFNMCILVVAR